MSLRPAAKIVAGLCLTLTLGSALALSPALGLGSAAAYPHTRASGASGQPGTITTIAGGIGGPTLATRVALALPCADVYARGELYFTDTGMGETEVIRAIGTHTDVLSTVAGNAGAGSAVEGGSAADALSGLGATCSTGVAVDHFGNVVFSQPFSFFQTGGSTVHVVAAKTGTFYGQAMLARHNYTIAGTGTDAYSGDGGPAVDAELQRPGKLAVDAAGNVVIADVGNKRVRVIAALSGTFYGVSMTAGDIYTVAGNGRAGDTGDGSSAIDAAVSPGAVRIDHHGNLVIADVGSRVIRVVPDVTGVYYGRELTAGDIYTIAGVRTSKPRTPCKGVTSGLPAHVARICDQGIAIDRPGNVVITGGGFVWVLAEAKGRFYGRQMRPGGIYQVVGPPQAGLPSDVSVDGQGNVVLTSPPAQFQLPPPGNAGAIYVLAQRSGHDFDQAMRAGKVYRVAGDGWISYSGDGRSAKLAQLGGFTRSSGYWGPIDGLAADPQGNVVVADTANLRLRVIAARTGRFYGKHMAAGDIYTIAGNGLFSGKTRDSGPLAGIEVDPTGLVIDKAGNLAVTGPVGDSGRGRLWLSPVRTGLHFGRRMTAGSVNVIGSCPRRCVKSPGQPAFDHAGNLLVNLQYLGAPHHGYSDRVFVVAARNGTFYGRRMLAGHMYPLAGAGPVGNAGDGGPALKASLVMSPVAVDRDGNVLLGQGGKLRVVAARTGTSYGTSMLAGHIYPVQVGCCGGQVAIVDGIAVDSAGNVVFTKSGQHREFVGMLAAKTGTFYGVPVVAGHSYAIAGTGVAGFSGDGGPATAAQLAQPGPLAITPAGQLLFGDLLRIRSIG